MKNWRFLIREQRGTLIAVALSVLPEPQYRVRAQVITMGATDPVASILGDARGGIDDQDPAHPIAAGKRLRRCAAKRARPDDGHRCHA